MLSPEDIAEFKQLYKKVYGVELSDKEASARAHNLLNLIEAVYEEALRGGNENLEGYGR
jgi:hypothetical protein